MKYLILFFALSLATQILNAQYQSGIKFEKNLSWNEIVDKSKKEHKYIFVDCYASWCLPCKKMDKEVYSNDSVGQFYNQYFIAVKVQMDTSKTDDLNIQQWYLDAKFIQHAYNIHAYPSLLFFSPDGALVHEFIGGTNVQGFLSISGDAVEPNKQYFVLLNNYKKGSRDTSQMIRIIKNANNLGEKETAKKVIEDLLTHYDTSRLYTAQNIQLIATILQSTKSKYFEMFYKNADTINKIIGFPNYAQLTLQRIINKEDVQPLVKRAEKNHSGINWQQISKSIAKKYNLDYANRAILTYKIDYYNGKDWKKYTSSIVDYIRQNDKIAVELSTWTINNCAWQIFLHSDNSLEIKSAIKWMEAVLQREPNDYYWLDTYANLLYKGGNTSEAVKYETRAIKRASQQNNLKIKTEDENTLEKMKAGLPTWNQ